MPCARLVLSSDGTHADRGSVTATTMLSDLLQTAITDSSLILIHNYIIVVDRVKAHVQSCITTKLRSCTYVRCTWTMLGKAASGAVTAKR